MLGRWSQVSFWDALLKGVSAVSFSECKWCCFFFSMFWIYRVKHLVGEEYFLKELRACRSNIIGRWPFPQEASWLSLLSSCFWGVLSSWSFLNAMRAWDVNVIRYLVLIISILKQSKYQGHVFLRRYSVAVQPCHNFTQMIFGSWLASALQRCFLGKPMP